MHHFVGSLAGTVLLTMYLAPSLAIPTGEVTQLIRFYNQQLNEHAYSHLDREISEWRRVPHVKEHYPIGLVATRQLPETVPLLRVVRKSDLRHFYTFDKPSQPQLFYIDDTNFHVFVWTKPGDGRVPVYGSTWTDKSDVYFEVDPGALDKFSFDTKRNLNVDRLRPSAGPMFYVYPISGIREVSPSVSPPPPSSSTVASTATKSKEQYLDELRESSSITSHGVLGKLGATGFPGVDVQRLRLKSTLEPVTHGLSYTPNGTDGNSKQVSHVRYELRGAYAKFRAIAAINFPTLEDGLTNAKNERWDGQAASPITFRVIGDGRILWESLPLQKHGEAQECEVFVAGVNQLRLEITCSSSQRFAWSFWAYPRLVLSQGADIESAPLKEVASIPTVPTMPELKTKSLADTIEHAERSVVRIDVQTDGGKVLGSGFLAQPGILVTNVHVLAGAQSANVIFPNEQIFRIEGTLFVDVDRDIAIAKLSSPAALDLPVLPLSNNLPRKGDRVVALGSPLGLSFTATSGVVSAIRQGSEISQENGRQRAGTWVQIDAALSSGNSGGPIINDDGEIVAMSTLASHSAQNLNFGISVVDIRQALETATSRTVSKLSEIASIPNSQPRMRGNDSTERVAIPESAIVEYIKRVRDEYPELKQALTRELATMRGRMKEMRAGEARIPRNLDSRDADIIYEIQPQRKSERKWYFRNEKIKQSEIETLDSRLRDLAKLSSQLQNVNDPTSLLALLWKYGPKIDTRQNGSVGFLDGCTVVKVLNGHDVMVTYNEVPYLVNLDTTVGLWIGHQLTPVPAFVNGTSSYHAVDGNSTTITLIQSVSKNQIERVLSDQIKSIGNQSPSESAGDGETKNNESIARKWRDRTSSFSVDAVLVEVTKSEVVLRKSDGKIVRVPRDKLSDEDQKHLTEIEKLKK